MRPSSSRGTLTRAASTLLLLAAAAAPLFAQGTTTATVRGRVISPDGNPVAATVTVTNTETGIARRVVAGDDGRYAVFALQVGGPYTVRAQAIGYRPQAKTGYVLAIGDIVTVDFTLESAPVQVSEVSVVAAATPIVDAQQPGLVSRVGRDQITSLPTNGRNFQDFVQLSPMVGVANPSKGAGGQLSIGGGRIGGNNILMDGVGANGTFFGGDARGSDRNPFAYSIEAVSEFQVESNSYDVTRGNYTGGVVNAVTRSGTNQLRGSIFEYRRSASLTHNDFLDREPTDFTSNQFGFWLGGPIIRDRLHFFVAVDRQQKDQPVFATDTSSLTAQINTGVAGDSVARLLNILQTTYGLNVAGLQGRVTTTVNETAIFARVDWQLSNRHQLSLRYNLTRFESANDRIVPTDLSTNGGIFLDRGKSFVGALTSQFSNHLFNELRVQYAREPRPRPGNVYMPEIRVSIRSEFRDSTGAIVATGSQTIRGGADPILHGNRIDENTTQIQDNLTYIRGNHTFKVGTDNSFYYFFDLFYNNGLGRYTFLSLADLENRAPDAFIRTEPPAGQLFPTADYHTREWAVYAQDQWQATPRLNLILGVRYDLTTFPDRGPANPALTRTFPDLDVSGAPRNRTDIAPRFGFTYDMSGDQTTIVRGGAGLYYGRSPSVLYANQVQNNGLGVLSLSCTSANGNVPAPDLAGFLADTSTIPTQCVGGGAAAAGTPDVFVMSRDYRTPRAFKTSIGVDHAVDRDTRVGLDFSYSYFDHNYIVIDRNLVTIPQFFTEGGRPVYAPPQAISTTSGSVNRNFNRVDAQFGQVLETVSNAKGNNLSFIVSATRRLRRNLSFQASYTYSRSWDNASSSCCIQSTLVTERPTRGNLNDLRDAYAPSDNDRPHRVILSGIMRLPWGVQLSGIYRGYSGVPFTPVISGDANGDGFTGQDNAYVGTNILYNFDPNSDVDSVTQRINQQNTLTGLINSWQCLRAALNTVIRRNACRNPWVNLLDVRLMKRFTTVRGQSIEVAADFFNVLNGLKSSWGRVMTVCAATFNPGGCNLLTTRGFNTTQNRFIYDVNPSFGTLVAADAFTYQQFQAQLGVRYNF